ncbi:Pyridoxal-5'-phosphate-dependent protein, beta subunit [Alkaliphilus metalliredigens QYMF]|uniref:cysteine synthase n=1 Tax=Alkaliphilus metalliredigens (strain QYMF) TaxID=293826 RepID=A6TVH5_ALKMQ|nr:cysteine synthase family protein [Alkaliphilus metalliredigens]ABR50193.1 Pyridoxal-5'-phosphate-dependent protein, beta subunit [Alkaliphilus metalliredigens QYMF]
MYSRCVEDRIKDLSNLIGNTPLLEIEFTYKGERRRIFAKAEHYNLTGSIKDRMALHIIKKGYESGELKVGDIIAEATSGNTGIAFSAIGSSLGHNVTIFMPDWMSEERKNLMKSYGADIQLVSKEQGGFLGSIAMAEEFAKDNENVFLPCQFSNENNCQAHYLTTGPEIWTQLQDLNLIPDGIVAGVGTGGTIMGIGNYLKEKNPDVKVYPLEPISSPTLTTGYKVGNHRMQGISDEFIPSIVKLNELDEVIAVDDGDAIIMAQKLANALGIGVGISSGGNFLGALRVQEILGKECIIVTIFSDDNKKYLSTDLMKKEPIKEGFMSTEVELISVISHKRQCVTCLAK